MWSGWWQVRRCGEWLSVLGRLVVVVRECGVDVEVTLGDCAWLRRLKLRKQSFLWRSS